MQILLFCAYAYWILSGNYNWKSQLDLCMNNQQNQPNFGVLHIGTGST